MLLTTSSLTMGAQIRSNIFQTLRWTTCLVSALAFPGGVLASSAAATSAGADVQGTSISGIVQDAYSAAPIANARVHLQAQPEPFVMSGADGSFTLPVTAAGFVRVTASVPYVRGGDLNYTTGGSSAQAGDVGIPIQLVPVPEADNPAYEPPSSQLCSICHFPIVNDWSTSSHARAADNEWVLDLFSGTGTAGGSEGYVFRDTHDADDTGFCATCHAPMADVFDPGNVMLNEVTFPATEGVNCVACHQIDSVEGDANALHHLGSATYRFPLDPMGDDTEFWVWGPLDDVTADIMSAVPGPHFKSPRLCASCHQYNNPNTGAPGQSTYDEWLTSPFAEQGPNFKTCQDCHEPASPTEGVACSTDPVVRPGDQIRSHLFEGSTPNQLQSNFRLDADARVSGGTVTVDVEVENFGAGHAFPTGVSIRNGLLVIEATFRGSELPQSSGSVLPFWASDDVPGEQPGDLAGRPGKGYARVLEGRINGEGPVVRPVIFIDAEQVFSDTRLMSGEIDQQQFSFALPPDALEGEPVQISARLLYRRAYRATAVTKGWQQTPAGFPIEIEMARQDLSVGVTRSPLEIPTAGSVALASFAAMLGLISVLWVRRLR